MCDWVSRTREKFISKSFGSILFGSKINAVDNESETDERREIEITLGDQFEKAMESKLENLRSSLRLELKEIRDEIKEDLEEKVEKILEKLN